jgi:hypothetical protein
MRGIDQSSGWLAALALILSLSGRAAAQDSGARNAEFKAAIVYNFARFATWPATRFSSDASPVVLCVDPSEPLLPALLHLDGQPVGARVLHVRAVQSFGPACHLAFVSSADAGAERLAALEREGVLTVGETPNFSRSGAIGLVTVGRQIRFEINTAAAHVAGVGLSSQLMRLAIVVRQ